MANIYVETMEGTAFLMEVKHYKCYVSHCRMCGANAFVPFHRENGRVTIGRFRYHRCGKRVIDF